MKKAAVDLIHLHDPEQHATAPSAYVSNGLNHWAREYFKDLNVPKARAADQPKKPTPKTPAVESRGKKPPGQWRVGPGEPQTPVETIRTPEELEQEERVATNRAARKKLDDIVGDRWHVFTRPEVIAELTPGRVLHLMDRYQETEGEMRWKDELGSDWSPQTVHALYPAFKQLFAFDDEPEPTGALSDQLLKAKVDLNKTKRQIESFRGDKRTEHYIKLCESELALENKMHGLRAWAHWTESPAARDEPLHPVFNDLFFFFNQARNAMKGHPKTAQRLRFETLGLSQPIVEQLSKNGYSTWHDFITKRKSIELALSKAVAENKLTVEHLRQLHDAMAHTLEQHVPS